MRGSFATRWLCAAAVLAGSLGVAARPAAAAPPFRPVYTILQPDAVTGDNPAQNVPTCTGCFIPDPGVDQYTADLYERPTQSGSGAGQYFPALDIVSGQGGVDARNLYYRINLFGQDPQGSLPYYYAVEINLDADPRGDIFVRSEDPKAKVGTIFGTQGVIGLSDQNNDVGSSRPLSSDGPNAVGDGYEHLAFDQGTNNAPGAAGGGQAIVARVVLVGGVPKAVEFAIDRAFLTAVNGGTPVTSAAFRPFASKSGATTSAANMYLHDKYVRRSAGSPYPWLALPGAPACPNELGTENALTSAERDALESGTNVETANPNPCYPSGGNIVEFDNARTLAQLGGGNDLSFVVGVPPGDWNGDAITTAGVFRPSSGAWFTDGSPTTVLGVAGDIPVPGDYDGDNDTDRAVYRPSTGAWYIEGAPTPTFLGTSTDIPVPCDWDGDRKTDIAIWRPSVGGWFINGGPTVFYGLDGDIPVPGDWDNDGDCDQAIWRPSVGGWYINGGPTVFHGLNGDVPVPGDYNGDTTLDQAVWRRSVGGWYINGQPTVFFGLNGDEPAPGNWDADLNTDIAIWRPSVGGWYINGGTTVFLGISTDRQVILPHHLRRPLDAP